ncbi:uncharacterized protein LOC115921248 [Strongylocentrotus purpuratus]|uniref:Reverse transcriptase domain-containing protein n=1 Tax=Strongylocentrotus purpuratus TaxID=7668 RepID=A0A7M7NC46_STRPU|nr:uncharacterized protein LOC115921248 [Strongylocentrotus purpuratus]
MGVGDGSASRGCLPGVRTDGEGRILPGLVPKRIEGEYRLIHHLSSPKGSSVNDCIDREEFTVRYSDFDEAVKLVVALGRNAFMGKSDIKSAFRLLPVNPADFDLLGMCFDGQFYFDRCMPMGCSVSCAVFERFSSFLQACCRRIASSQGILHYLDDFFFVGRAADECAHLMRCSRAMCDRFGIPIADEKTEGPVQVITYLGLEIDSTELQVRVPKEKLRVLLSMLDDFASKSKLTLRQLQSLTGSLNFVCKAIGPGRAFLRRLIDLTRGVHKAHHRIRISKGAKADLLAWREFLLHFNGTVCFGDSVWRRNDFFQFYTDAAGSIGFGIYFESRWAQARWPEEPLHSHSPLDCVPSLRYGTQWCTGQIFLQQNGGKETSASQFESRGWGRGASSDGFEGLRQQLSPRSRLAHASDSSTKDVYGSFYYVYGSTMSWRRPCTDPIRNIHASG